MSEYNKLEEKKIKKTWDSVLTKIQNKLEKDKIQHNNVKKNIFDISSFFFWNKKFLKLEANIKLFYYYLVYIYLFC